MASDDRGPWYPILTAIHDGRTCDLDAEAEAARALLVKYRGCIRHVDGMSFFKNLGQGREEKVGPAMDDSRGLLKTLTLNDSELSSRDLGLVKLDPVPLKIFVIKALDEESHRYNSSIAEEIAASWAMWQIILLQRQLERLQFDRSCRCLKFLDFRPPGSDIETGFAGSGGGGNNLLGTSPAGVLSSPGGLFLRRVLESLPRLYHLGLPDHKNIMPVLEVLAALAASSTSAAANTAATRSGIRSLCLRNSSMSEWPDSCQHLINPKIQTLSLVNVDSRHLLAWMKAMPALETLTIWLESYRDPSPEKPWDAFLRARETAYSSSSASACASNTTSSSLIFVSESGPSTTAAEKDTQEGWGCWTRNRTIRTLKLKLWGIALAETPLI